MRTTSLVFAAVLAAGTACTEKEKQPTKPAPAAEPAAKTAPSRPTKMKPREPAPPKVDPALLEQGKYLVEVVMACAACHTPLGERGPDMSKRFAGGLEIPEPFGTWRSPNITQDKKTGIGGWTDAQIIAGVREGKRPDGTQMYPVMPYMFYSAMSDDDAKAMVAYLRTIAPIEHAVAGNTDLKLPKMAGPPPSGKGPPPGDPVKRGEYLAALMHCAACHTPMTEQGPDMAKMFAGGMEMEMPMLGSGKLFTANLTSDKATGLGDWTDAQIAAVITKNQKKDGSPVMGPMMFMAPSWANLTPDDVAALVAFLRQLPPIVNKVPASTFKPAGPPPGGPPPGGDKPAEAPPK